MTLRERTTIHKSTIINAFQVAKHEASGQRTYKFGKTSQISFSCILGYNPYTCSFFQRVATAIHMASKMPRINQLGQRSTPITNPSANLTMLDILGNTTLLKRANFSSISPSMRSVAVTSVCHFLDYVRFFLLTRLFDSSHQRLACGQWHSRSV